MIHLTAAAPNRVINIQVCRYATVFTSVALSAAGIFTARQHSLLCRALY